MLEYTITNTLQGGGGNRSAQYVSQSTGKLSMELLFDTTDSGEDVRRHTEKVAKLMDPGGGGNQSQQRKPPPIATFEWGAYKFEGIVESYKEKIDFFSSDGVPLRATINLTLSRQDKVFDSDKNADASVGGSLGSGEGTVEAPLGSGQNGGRSRSRRATRRRRAASRPTTASRASARRRPRLCGWARRSRSGRRSRSRPAPAWGSASAPASASARA